jgi:predicted TPR repeat methyltransferase
MLAQAANRQLYVELRETDIIDDLAAQRGRWPLVIAADVACYFGNLRDLMQHVRRRLTPDGWFVFSVETLLPDQYGILPGNADWALRQAGRYAHTPDHVHDRAAEAGLRVIRSIACIIRQEAGCGLPGQLFTVTPVAA